VARVSKGNKSSTVQFNLNFVYGCQKVSEGCVNCYIDRDPFAHGIERFKLPDAFSANKNGQRNVGDFNEESRLKELDKLPNGSWVFVNNVSDTFLSPPAITDEMRDRWLGYLADRPQYQFKLCTKRTGQMVAYFRTRKVPNNVWVGSTIENRKALELRLPLLLSIDTPNRWINFEPLLEDVSEGLSLKGISWACVGGETGSKYRPFRIDWAYKLYMIAQRDHVTFWFEGGNGKNESNRQRGSAFPRDRPEADSKRSDGEQTALFDSNKAVGTGA